MIARIVGAMDLTALFVAWCREGMAIGAPFLSWAASRDAASQPAAGLASNSRACRAGIGRVTVLLPGPVVRVRPMEHLEREPAIADARLLGWGERVTPFLWTRRGELFAGPGLASALIEAGPSWSIGVRALGGLEVAGGKVIGLTDAAGAGLRGATAARLREFGLMLEAANAILPTARVRCHSGSGAFSGSWSEFRPRWIDEVSWVCDQAPAVRA